LEDLKSGELEFPIVEDFLTNLKKKFRNRNNKIDKVTELKKVEQENKIIEEYMQEF